MIYYFDTSALIRFFSNDDLNKAEKVKNILEDDLNEIKIPDVVFPEIEYVLSSKLYQLSRAEITKAFKFLLSHRNTKLSAHTKSALHFFESTKLDCADCFVLVSSKSEKLLSFDNRLTQTHQQIT